MGKLKLGAISIHQHVGQWVEVFALVHDGMAFSRDGGKPAAGLGRGSWKQGWCYDLADGCFDHEMCQSPPQSTI